jgi:hypothetical protein
MIRFVSTKQNTKKQFFSFEKIDKSTLLHNREEFQEIINKLCFCSALLTLALLKTKLQIN